MIVGNLIDSKFQELEVTETIDCGELDRSESIKV
jgi:hypothetical protein